MEEIMKIFQSLICFIIVSTFTIFAQQLEDIVKRLEQGRPKARLKARRDTAINPGKQPAHQGRQNQTADCAEDGEHYSRPPTSTTKNAVEMMSMARVILLSPKYWLR